MASREEGATKAATPRARKISCSSCKRDSSSSTRSTRAAEAAAAWDSGECPGGADHDGKQDRESGAARRRVTDLNFAAVFFDDAVANAEAEASSLPYGLGGVERIENAVGIFHARAAVGEFDREAIAGDGGANPDFTFTAVFADGVYGVVKDVEKNLLKLVEIAGGEREVGIEIAMDVDAVELHIVFAKDESFFENLIELDGGAFGLVLASEAQRFWTM